MDIVTLGAALNGSAEYVNSHFKGGSNIQIVDNPDGTQTINASGEVSSEDAVARAEIAAIKDGETLDSFGDVETALDDKADEDNVYKLALSDADLLPANTDLDNLKTVGCYYVLSSAITPTITHRPTDNTSAFRVTVELAAGSMRPRQIYQEFNSYDKYIRYETSSGTWAAWKKVECDLSTIYTKTAVDTALGNKADKSTTYTKTEVDTALGSKQDTISDLSTIRSGAALGATAVQPETGKGLSTNDYTTVEKTKLDSLAEIKTIGTGLDLDSNGELTVTGGGGGGFTPTTAQLAAMNSGITAEKLQADETALAGKVDKETGKGLSANDFTTAEKTKLAGIAEGAEVNVQSNWTQTTTTADDYIKNKPTLGTAAAKNATDTYNATGTDVTTGKAVAAALATLPEPMVFQGSLGTGGTITTLPTASSSNKGYVYKVITAGTYASQSAKIGDTFISDGSAWVLIPSGDEPSGTVTNVAVANGGGLTVSGSPITTSGTITVGHSNSVTAKSTSSLKKFTYDAQGHVTGSSELSTAESNALASGIDSTKVAQIETNKNNISKYQVKTLNVNFNDLTFTQSIEGMYYSNEIAISGLTMLLSVMITGFVDIKGTDVITPIVSNDGSKLRFISNVATFSTSARYSLQIFGINDA